MEGSSDAVVMLKHTYYHEICTKTKIFRQPETLSNFFVEYKKCRLGGDLN